MRRWALVLIRGVVQETPAPRRPACPARESGPAVRDKRTKTASGDDDDDDDDEPRVLPPSAVCPIRPHETSYTIRQSDSYSSDRLNIFMLRDNTRERDRKRERESFVRIKYCRHNVSVSGEKCVDHFSSGQTSGCSFLFLC